VPLGIRERTSAAANNTFPTTIVPNETINSDTLRIAFLECARPKVPRPTTIRSPPTIATRSAMAASSPRRRSVIDAAIIIAIAV